MYLRVSDLVVLCVLVVDGARHAEMRHLHDAYVGVVERRVRQLATVPGEPQRVV